MTKRAKAPRNLVVDRWNTRVALERDRQDAGRFIDDKQRVVFIDDVEPVSLTLPDCAPGGAGAVGPEPDDIPG